MPTTKSKANKCVTHHKACDCREYRYEQMESALRVIRTFAGFEIETGVDTLNPEQVLNLCNKALGK